MQHAWKHVERPGGSHTALDGKKEVNRKRAPSGSVKVVVTNQPHSRRHTGVDLVSGTTYWRGFRRAGPDRAMFLGEAGGNTQAPQEVSFSCPHRVFEGLQSDAADQVLQAVNSI